jgi:phosphatidylserine/phosphatidylglycerophosphate/cardiolipin synthase-like enzyme
LRFEIHEYKPFPSGVTPRVAASVPLAAATVSGSGSGSGKHKRSKRRDPAPLTRPGVRRGLHAKSIVVDGRVAMIGSHNFDPRSDKYNTEAGLIIWDEALAVALTREIATDISPENAWVIAPREGIPLVSDVSGVVETVSEQLPLFDLWPFRYSTSFELKPDCAPMSPFDPDFHRCHRPVGDFPEVNLSLKDIYTRIITAFGVGLTPIL